MEEEGELFGENNLFQKDNTSTIVIASSDEVDVLIIDPNYLKRLFSVCLFFI